MRYASSAVLQVITDQRVGHRLRCYNVGVTFLRENGKCDPVRSKPLNRLKFVRIDYDNEGNVCIKFGESPFTVAFLANG